MTTAPLLLTLVLAIVPGPGPSASAVSGGSAQSARGPVILDFHADWCPPCKQMRPRVETLVKNRYPVQSIDVDEHPELVERYGIEGVPTFVIVDAEGRELSRREGLVETRELADLYRDAARPTPVRGETNPPVRNVSNASAGSSRSNPDPWATVVRITVKDRGSLGFGSGTVIESSPEESIILTCAHIFTVKGRQPRPDQFNLPVLVELFDGKLGGPGGQTVRPLGKPMPGEVIDYDFDRDVALVRIRPGAVVPSARVVPQHWQAKARMSMYTVGCSHGEDATAWNTVIFAPTSRYQVPGKRNYEAIECQHSPKQGRSGGGLFTEDGYVAGVCNFAFDPSVGRGLYASPNSIYAILDRNNMSHLYEYRAPRGPQLYLADNANESGNRQDSQQDYTYRLQNGGEDEAVASANSGRNDRMLNVDPIVVPRPEFLGIQLPEESLEPAREARPRPAVKPELATGRAERPGRSAWTPVIPGSSSSGQVASSGSGTARQSNRPASSGEAASNPSGSKTDSRRASSRSGWSTIGSRGR
ncbi:thioredoxin domain-containing protein [Tautonia marina]|uniref:thioredoxin domain-containing protein n=1 Tax=Tautonia marina TaxID=2653855 RepID=UPI001375D279|nr:thioredoxin domain-containing protein [Tautonia marina]